MKFFFLVFFFIININYVKADDWGTQLNQTIINEFRVNNKMILPLDDGEWLLVTKSDTYVGWGIGVQEKFFVQLENNIPVRYFSIGRATGLGKWQSYLTSIIEGATFQSKEGGCRKRQHYNYLNVYKVGAAHNCMVVTITDVQRELNPSVSDPDAIFTLNLRSWINRENIDMPKIYLEHSASYVSTSVRDEWYVISYGVTPEKFAGYKAQFSSRDTTEFHPDKIDNYPAAKQIMKDWLKKSASFHQNFENFQAMKKHQRLKLDDVLPIASNNKTKPNDLTDQLKKLNDLYNSGVLTKDEFERAKAKILK